MKLLPCRKRIESNLPLTPGDNTASDTESAMKHRRRLLLERAADLGVGCPSARRFGARHGEASNLRTEGRVPIPHRRVRNAALVVILPSLPPIAVRYSPSAVRHGTEARALDIFIVSYVIQFIDNILLHFIEGGALFRLIIIFRGTN